MSWAQLLNYREAEMRCEGGGPSGTGTWRMRGSGVCVWGGCFTATVSPLLRAGILMRSVNECWHRWGCAAGEKQPPCPCRTAAAPHSKFHLTSNQSCSSFLSQISPLFLCLSSSFISDVFFFFSTLQHRGSVSAVFWKDSHVLACLVEPLLLSSGVCIQQWIM